jgi:hypothetical protein
MDWDCPTFDMVQGAFLTSHHGNLTAARFIQEGLPTTNTGNLHVAIFHTEPGMGAGAEEDAIYFAIAAGAVLVFWGSQNMSLRMVSDRMPAVGLL